MLDVARIASWVMTGEDETADGRGQARMNATLKQGSFKVGSDSAAPSCCSKTAVRSSAILMGSDRFGFQRVPALYHSTLKLHSG